MMPRGFNCMCGLVAMVAVMGCTNTGPSPERVRTGQNAQIYDPATSNAILFSPDGKRMAYVARQGKYWNVVVDEQQGMRYDEIRSLQFSPDSKHCLYTARNGNTWRVVVDEHPHQSFDEIAEPNQTR